MQSALHRLKAQEDQKGQSQGAILLQLTVLTILSALIWIQSARGAQVPIDETD